MTFFRKKSKKEDKYDKNIQKELNKQQQQNSRSYSLLLLGSGGCGKSTVMKQMERIYKEEDDWKNDTKLEWILKAIHKNIIHDIIDLCKCAVFERDQNGLDFEEPEQNLEELLITTSKKKTFAVQTLTIDFARDIAALWNTSLLKKVFDIRRHCQVMDNTPYFLDNVVNYSQIDFVPTFDDYIRTREQTTGVHRTELRVTGPGSPRSGKTNEYTFIVIDVGGQRSEQKKWFRVFDGIDCVIFIMSLSAYDEVLYEDNTQNCWDETFDLFGRTIDHKTFKSTNFIVFLNKSDLFQTKIKTTSFRTYLDSSNSGGNSNSQPAQFDDSKANSDSEVIAWTKERFLAIFENSNKKMKTRKKSGAYRECSFHVTCATDNTQIDSVMSLIQISILNAGLSNIFE